MPEPYHTALRSGVMQDAAPVSAYAQHNGVALCYDVAGPEDPPIDYAECDAFYSDPPWPAGLTTFETRAWAYGTDYAVSHDWTAMMLIYLDRFRAFGKPVIFSMNRSSHKNLPKPDSRVLGTLNGARCTFWGYGTELPELNFQSTTMLHGLASFHRCIGDPFCGYGQSGRIFAQHRKRFVLSDLNSACIGHIAEHARDW